jgi:hypothetical protein
MHEKDFHYYEEFMENRRKLMAFKIIQSKFLGKHAVVIAGFRLAEFFLFR